MQLLLCLPSLFYNLTYDDVHVFLQRLFIFRFQTNYVKSEDSGSEKAMRAG